MCNGLLVLLSVFPPDAVGNIPSLFLGFCRAADQTQGSSLSRQRFLCRRFHKYLPGFKNSSVTVELYQPTKKNL